MGVPSELEKKRDGHRSEREGKRKNESTVDIRVKNFGRGFYILEPSWY